VACIRCGQVACRGCVVKWAAEAMKDRVNEILGKELLVSEGSRRDPEREPAKDIIARALVMCGGVSFRCPFCNGECHASSLRSERA
jgi:hypothetical protein